MNKSIKSVSILLVFILSLVLIKEIVFSDFVGPNTIDNPVQINVEDQTIQHIGSDGNTYEITLLESYKGAFAIKGTKNYTTDGASVVSPKDAILAWGDLSDSKVDAHIKYSQSNRWYYFRYSGDSLVSGDYISQHSSNTHLIPADESIAKAIKKIGKNDYVHLEGFLAIVHFSNGDWSSSLTREDTGDGACEIFYITDVN